MLIKQRLEGHDKPRCTETALRSIVIDECLLDGMQTLALHQRFDGGDRIALRLNGQNRARVDGPVVHEHSAGTAFSAIAHTLGAGDLKLITERIEQSDAGLKLQGMFLSVDSKFDGNLARAINLNRFTGSLNDFCS